MLSVWCVAIHKFSAMPSARLTVLLMGSQSFFYEMACVAKARKHSPAYCRSIFETLKLAS